MTNRDLSSREPKDGKEHGEPESRHGWKSKWVESTAPAADDPISPEEMQGHNLLGNASLRGGAIAGVSDPVRDGHGAPGERPDDVDRLIRVLPHVCVVAAMLGAVALRKLRGDYFAITTVAFTFIVTLVFSQNFRLFNGFLGVFNIPQPFYDFLHQPDIFTYNLVFIGLCFVCLAIVYVVTEWLFKSPFGMTLRSIREDEQASAAYGRDVYIAKLKAFVIGGMVAGLGGSLFAVYLSSWNPSAWSPIEGFLIFAAIFLGGQGNVRGVILGVVIVTILIPESTRWLPEFQRRPDLYPALRNIAAGILILAVLRWRPQGIIPERHLNDTRASAGFRIPLLPQTRTPDA